jgi:hypothetical protein
LKIVPRLSLSAHRAGAVGATSEALPPTAWVVSFDVSLARQSRLVIGLGSDTDPLVLSRGSGAVPTLAAARRSSTLTNRAGWGNTSWRHVEIRGGIGARLSVDGQPFPVVTARGGKLSFQIGRGDAVLRALIISAASDRASLLFHRLAELHARLSDGAFPLGADRRDRLYFSSNWTTGFWPGALWQAAALEPAGGMFSQWALAATIHHLGRERADTHDVGFMYGQSSLAAWRARCRGVLADARTNVTGSSADQSSRSALCTRLKDSVLAAANELLALAASNPGAGTIPTNDTSPNAETIVDSMMNIGILPWATRITGNRAYMQLALHQAHVIAALLVRPDGSTIQAVHFDRPSGRIAFIGTHQGIADTSTWSRGQAWAIYGFAQAAVELHDRGLLGVAQHLASYVSQHLPADGVPLWDYNAPPGSPVDVSAGVITAAGLLRLASACGQISGVCGSPEPWISLAREMLSAGLREAYGQPPIGFLSSQVLDGRLPTCCNGGELSFGLSYALEALKLERAAG